MLCCSKSKTYLQIAFRYFLTVKNIGAKGNFEVMYKYRGKEEFGGYALL